MSFATERHLDGLVVIGARNRLTTSNIMDPNPPCVFMDSYITKLMCTKCTAMTSSGAI